MLRTVFFLTAALICSSAGLRAEPPTPIYNLKGHTGAVMSFAFSRDGKWIASGEMRGDNVARIWDIATQSVRHVLQHSTNTTLESVAFSPDGLRLATVDFDHILLWDVETGKQLAKWKRDGQNAALGVAFSQDGRLVVGGGGTWVQCWDVKTGRSVFSQSMQTNGIFALAPNSLEIATDENGLLSIWSVPSNKKLNWLDGYLGTPSRESLRFSSDGKVLAIGEAGYGPNKVSIQLWDYEKRKRIADLPSHSPSIRSVYFTKDNRQLISLEANGVIYRWDLTTGKLLKEWNAFRGKSIGRSCIDPDLKRLATSDGEHHVLVYDLSELFQE